MRWRRVPRLAQPCRGRRGRKMRRTQKAPSQGRRQKVLEKSDRDIPTAQLRELLPGQTQDSPLPLRKQTAGAEVLRWTDCLGGQTAWVSQTARDLPACHRLLGGLARPISPCHVGVFRILYDGRHGVLRACLVQTLLWKRSDNRRDCRMQRSGDSQDGAPKGTPALFTSLRCDRK